MSEPAAPNVLGFFSDLGLEESIRASLQFDLSTGPPRDDLLRNLASRPAPELTAALIIILAAVMEEKKYSPEPMLAACGHVFSHAAPQQLRVVRRQVTTLARGIAVATVQGRPDVGHRLLKTLLQAVQSDKRHAHTLTPLHAEYARLAIHARAFSGASDIVSVPIFEVGSDSGVNIRDVLLYHYYGGILLTANGLWGPALSMFRTCLTVPVAAMSAIQVEAHRKFVLVSLINKGTVEVVPKAVNGKLAAALMSLDASYTNLGKLVTEALDKSSTQGLETYIHEHSAMYFAHGNMGLATQVLHSVTRRKIKQMTKAFTAVPLAAVASAAGLVTSEAAEALVCTMIERGELHASIDQGRGVVRFHDDLSVKGASSGATSSETERLSADIEAVTALVSRVKLVEEDILLSKQHMKRLGGVGGGVGGSLASERSRGAMDIVGYGEDMLGNMHGSASMAAPNVAGYATVLDGPTTAAEADAGTDSDSEMAR